MNEETLPGVTTLIQRGFAIYKEEFDTLVGLSALYLGFSFLGVAAFIGSIFLVVISLPVLGAAGFILMSIFGIVVFLAFGWALLRILLGILYTVRDYDEHLSIKAAIARGRGKVFSFLWVMVLTLLAVIGSLVCIFVAGLIIMFPFFFLSPAVSAGVGFLVLFAGSVVAVLVTGTWFAFTSWLFVDQDARGLHALALSRHLSHVDLGAVMWRVFGISIVASLALIAFQVVFGILFAFSQPVGDILARLLSNVSTTLIVVPILYGAMFSLYTSLEANQDIDVDSKEHGEHRGVLSMLIVLGFLALCALPVIIGFIMAMTSGR